MSLGFNHLSRVPVKMPTNKDPYMNRKKKKSYKPSSANSLAKQHQKQTLEG